MFLEGRFEFDEFLRVVGDEADGGTGDLECESVYAVLNRLEKRVADQQSYEDLISHTHNLFEKYLALAKTEWSQLVSRSGFP